MDVLDRPVSPEVPEPVFGGPQDYNRRSLDEIFSPQGVSRLSISHERQEEMLGEVGSVRRCAVP